MKKNSLHIAILYIICSCFFFTLMSVFIKLSFSGLMLVETIFLRSFSALLIITPLVYLKKKKYKTRFFKLHFLRSLIGTIAMLCMFYALSKLPISNVIIISFSKIFFIIPLAIFFLGERVSLNSFLLICLGFLGVISAIGIETYLEQFNSYFFAFAGAFLIAMVKILIKKIAINEDTLQIQFWFAFLSSSFLLIPYIISVSSFPSYQDLFIVFFSSIFGLLAQYFTISGLKLADATKILPFDFFRVIFGIFFGIAIFSEKITFNVMLGAFLILLSSVYLIKRN